MHVPATPTTRNTDAIRCRACGYPIEGLRAWQLGCACPECGSVNDPYDPARAPLRATRLPGPIAVCWFGFRTSLLVIPFVVAEQWLRAPALVAPVLGFMLILADVVEFARRSLTPRVALMYRTVLIGVATIGLTIANLLLVAGVSWGVLVMLGVL